MKRLNKKGVTLIELIVSFAIVSVAMIYFYQSIVDLHRIYKNSNNATDEFVKKTYALRVLDAWVSTPGNDLNTIDKSYSPQNEICKTYNMFCIDTSTAVDTSNPNYQKVTLSDGKINVVYYRGLDSIYEEKLIADNIINGSGNVESFSAISGFAGNEGAHVVVGINSDNKLIYTIIDNTGKEKYKKTNTNTIKEIIENEVDEKTAENINNKVQTLAGNNYIVKESVEEIEDGVYVRSYNIIDKDTNDTLVKNIYEIENTQMEKLSEFKLADENIIDKEIIFNNNIQKVQNTGSYYLTFELSSNSENNYCALFFNTGEKEYNFRWNSKTIDNSYINNVNDIGINYEKKNDGSYTASFIRFNVTSSNAYIKPYIWSGTDCKAKLIEAYKYK